MLLQPALLRENLPSFVDGVLSKSTSKYEQGSQRIPLMLNFINSLFQILSHLLASPVIIHCVLQFLEPVLVLKGKVRSSKYSATCPLSRCWTHLSALTFLLTSAQVSLRLRMQADPKAMVMLRAQCRSLCL